MIVPVLIQYEKRSAKDFTITVFEKNIRKNILKQISLAKEFRIRKVP